MQPDYLAFNSMSFSNGANRDTELQVIVYQYWNADEVVAEIEAEHNQINVTPTILLLISLSTFWPLALKKLELISPTTLSFFNC